MIFLSVASSMTALAVVSLPDAELTLSEGQTERDAVLLECCDLPDKGITLSETELDGIVSRFTGPVPLKLEHIDTPLGDLGTVKRIWREGKQLLGQIALRADVAGLVRSRGCKGLSCGLSIKPLSLEELSLVLKPRVQAAVLLSVDDQAELTQLRAQVLQQRVDTQIADLKRAGKITPATEGAARVLLSAGDAEHVTLSTGGTQGVSQIPISEAFMAYLSAQPAVVNLSEMAPDATKQSGLYGSADGEDDDEVTLDDEQKHFLSKSLGVDPEKVAATMKADRAVLRSSVQRADRHRATIHSSTRGAMGSGHHGTSPAPHPQKGHRV